MGVDFGTSGVRVGIFDTAGSPVVLRSVEFGTAYPRSGWAEQDPDVWWRSFVTAAGAAVAASGLAAEQIVGISSDATAATVLLIGQDDRPLRPAVVWMDVRAPQQADRLAATGDPALKYCGYGAVSAEWGLPKALWLAENEPDLWQRARYVADCNDWFVHRLTGQWASSVNILSGKYLYDRDTGGHPSSLLDAVGFGAFLDKLPATVADLGERVGELRADVASEIGLMPGTPVAMGGIDAHVGALGLGVVAPGTMALITGSSHVMIGQTATPLHGTGFWGSYTDALVRGQYTVEAGQASTGSVVRWFKDHFASAEALQASAEGRDVYDLLTEEARRVPIGSDGLVWLDSFQGNRSPHTDPYVRGAVWGLGLGHTPAHLFRALLEGICFGTAAIFAALATAGYEPQRLVISGGATKNPLWLQMHADTAAKPIQLTACPDGPALGSAMLAAVGAGLYRDIADAASHMVHVTRTIEPDLAAHERYRPYLDLYTQTYPALAPLMHHMTALQTAKGPTS